MRVSASLGAIVATGLLGHTSAQAADYGSTGGNPNGFPSDITGNIPPTSSNGSPGTFPPGTAPGGAPGGVPPIGPVIPTGGIPGSGFPTFVTSSGPPTDIPGDGSVIVPGSVPNPGGVPGGPGGHGAPGASNPVYPTCATSTTTIVVTVYATNSNDSPDGSTDGSSGGFPNDSPNSPSDGSDPHQTVAQPPAPTEPPSFTINSANLPVAPFTTLTIDIWGPGDDDNGSEDDDGTGPVDGADPSDGAGTGNDDTGNGDDNAPTDGSNPTDGGFPGDGSIPGDGSVPGEDPNSPTFSSTTAPDTAPEYSSDESGVFPTAAPGDVSGGLPGDSVSSQAPASFPSQAPSSGNPGDAPGVPPFNPSVDSGAHLSDSLPVSTRIISQAPAEVSPWLTWGPATVGNAPLPTSWVTITGADGLPTVVNGGSGVGGNIPGDQGWPPFVSSDASPASGGPGLPQGLPTSLPFPPPAGVTAGPGGAVPGGPSDGSGSSFPGDDSANGITTCTQVTVIGSDGLPTVIDSTWVIPASAVATQASAQLPAPGITQGPGGIPATGTPAGPDGSFYITSTTYTVIGSDGLPTVVQSTWVVPDPTQVVSIQTQAPFPGIPSSDPNGLPGGISGIPGGIATGPGQQGGGAPITTCTSYTVIGTDGLPTVVESTWLVPGPVNTLVPFPGSPTNPSGASSALPNGIPPVITDFPPSDGSAGPGVTRGAGITTCTSYTAIGADGLPTVIDSTWVIPGAANTQGPLSGNPSYVSNPSPPGFPTGVPGKITASPELPYPGDGSARGVATCASYTIIGADGLPTVVESTWVVPDESALPTATGADFPQITSSTSDAAAGQFTVVTTEIVVGTDGQPTPVVQTVVLTSASDLGVPHGTVSGLPAPPPSGPVISSGDLHPLPTGLPALSDYGAASGFPSVVGSSDDAQATFISGTVTGTLTYTTTQVVDSTGEPIFSDGAQDPLGTGVPVPDVGYGPVPSEITLWPQASNVQTSIWTNLIEEPTTTYTIKFPLTTMATITVPAGSSVGKRVLRRQDSSEPSFPTWSNSSSAATSLTESTSLLASFSALTTGDALPAPSVTSSAASGAPTMCSTGGIIGNTTIDFDNSMPGPLFNPLEAIWFSEGFHIVPPSLQPVQPYVPTSGGQVVEFVPPSLSNTTSSGSSDVAEVGMGPHSPSPCFRFDFFGASLGCETQGNEEWCEFEISAYRYNDTSASEESIAWSEIKQVPACSTFLEGGYQLTPIELEGYKDLSSVLITLRVGLELRTWWADDFRVGWTDNSCVAEACRSDSPHILAKRETVESVLSRGIWGWTPTGFERLNYTLVPESMN
ncbi:hypothetical protein EDB81DRAFT_731477 [Dactylonectria macrodidyma]|uniref:DUF7371 domain-containing protein n=1 Tax=Dactylonectria macrodidyma TaxID=307937 RepID=A0A9P9DPV5_9HYPO|nr:hypothetical protein EDB81DRAFT_731477 [Dactylonectria macrodidyma]